MVRLQQPEFLKCKNPDRKKEAPRRALGLETLGRQQGQGGSGRHPLMHPVCFSMIASALAAVMSARSFREGQARRRLPSAIAEWSTFLMRRSGRRSALATTCAANRIAYLSGTQFWL